MTDQCKTSKFASYKIANGDKAL